MASGKVHGQQGGGAKLSFNHNPHSNWASSKEETHVEQEVSEAQRCENTYKGYERFHAGLIEVSLAEHKCPVPCLVLWLSFDFKNRLSSRANVQA